MGCTALQTNVQLALPTTTTTRVSEISRYVTAVTSLHFMAGPCASVTSSYSTSHSCEVFYICLQYTHTEDVQIMQSSKESGKTESCLTPHTATYIVGELVLLAPSSRYPHHAPPIGESSEFWQHVNLFQQKTSSFSSSGSATFRQSKKFPHVVVVWKVLGQNSKGIHSNTAGMYCSSHLKKQNKTEKHTTSTQCTKDHL